MFKKRLSVIEPACQKGIAGFAKVSARFAGNIAEFAIFDNSSGSILALEVWEAMPDLTRLHETLSELKKDSFILNQPVSGTVVICDSPVYTIIPEELYSEEDALKYLELNYKFETNEKTNRDILQNISIVNTYHLPAEIVNISSDLQGTEFRHSISILLQALFRTEQSGDVAIVNFSGKRTDVMIRNGNTLKFCNSFNFTAAEDIAYFILNVFQNIHVNSSSVMLYLCGDIEKESAAFNIIYKYVKNVSFCKRPQVKGIANAFTELPEHPHFVILNSLQ